MKERLLDAFQPERLTPAQMPLARAVGIQFLVASLRGSCCLALCCDVVSRDTALSQCWLNPLQDSSVMTTFWHVEAEASQ